MSETGVGAIELVQESTPVPGMSQLLESEIGRLREEAGKAAACLADATARLLLQANKHARATALVASLQRDLTAERERVRALGEVWSFLWRGCDMSDWGRVNALQEIAVKVGLLRFVPLNEQEGEVGPGSYLLTDLGKACLPERTEGEEGGDETAA